MAYKYIESKEKTYAKVYKVYSGIGGTTISIKDKYPDIDYTQLTSDDFFATYLSDDGRSGSDKSTAGYATRYWTQVLGATINCTYTPSTGSLRIAPSSNSAFKSDLPDGKGGEDVNTYGWNNLKIEAIMVVDGIKSDYT